jgi:hypothetical protein
MPTLWAHRNYFNNSSTAVKPTLAASEGGYPRWQASVIAVGSFPGQLQVYWERLVAWVRSWRAARPAIIVAPASEAAVLDRVRTLLEHPAYPFAQAAVRQTATTLGFTRPEAWQGLSRHMKEDAGRAENVFRHMRACVVTRATAPSTLTNPDCNLLVELAYHEFAARGE